MEDQERLLIGGWLDAVGTIISAIAEVRTLVGLNDVNNRLVAIGEGLQAVGTLLVGTVTEEDPLNFAGNWIDGAGAATSSIGAYMQDFNQENEKDGLLIETLGDALQSMGASLSAVADHLAGEEQYALGNAIQALGAGLEAIGGAIALNNKEEEARPIITIGAIIQAIGSNLNAIFYTKEVLQERS